MRAGGLSLLLVTLVVPTQPGTALGEDPVSIPGWFNIAVPGGEATLEALRIPPEERALTLSLLARILHGQGNSLASAEAMRSELRALLSPPPAAADASGLPSAIDGMSGDAKSKAIVPAPLSAAIWMDLLDLEREADLFSAIVNNRSALLFCSGATAADSSVRILLERDRNLTRWIFRRAPGAFSIAGRSLRLADGRVAVPGGSDGEAVWEALAGASPARPGDFIRALLGRDGGRLAWFYDAMASLPSERAAQVVAGVTPGRRVEQARDLYSSFRDTDQNWRVEDHPFMRNAADPPSVLSGFDAPGAGPLSSQGFWEILFSRGDIGPDDAR
ncbi:MAG TPA: hypothetical protein VIE39_02755, partial [Thermoanaerobaculia bacterium]